MLKFFISLIVLLMVMAVALGKLTRFLRALQNFKQPRPPLSEERFSHVKQADVIEIKTTKLD